VAVDLPRFVRPRRTYAVVYMDNGPGGPCGQDSVTNSPHTRVYLFDTENEMCEWLRLKYDEMPKRKNSRVTCCYPKGDSYTHSNGLEWPNDERRHGTENQSKAPKP
jgi:hypothetical protein